MHITSQYLVNEEKVVVATSRMQALEAETSNLRKDMIVVMDINNTSKEKIKTLFEQQRVEKLLVKQKDEQLMADDYKMKNAVAKAVHAFQRMYEYNAILFGWYFKGFGLLRRYLVKHGPQIDLGDLDFEAIDKEIEADEAMQATQATVTPGKDRPEAEKDGNDPPTE